MKVEDARGFYFITRTATPNFTVKTYDAHILHHVHGYCRMVIHRAVGNDSHLKAMMTKAALEKSEPTVGMWPGDRIEYFDDDGLLIERING